MVVPEAHFTVFIHVGPNPYKVVIVLEELGLSYKTVYVDASGENKREPYTRINPNGRMPALIDHRNNDFTIWESGAIVLYLVEKYDTRRRILSFDSFESNAIAKQYLMFQMSGQGPYFGQAMWFINYHPENVPSAIERYMNEIRRVLGVLADVLKHRRYLVEDRASYADLSFLPWMWALDSPALGKGEWKKDRQLAPLVDWYNRLNARPAVIKSRQIQMQLIQEKWNK